VACAVLSAFLCAVRYLSPYRQAKRRVGVASEHGHVSQLYAAAVLTFALSSDHGEQPL
jgi:hypothetical protein